MSFTKNVLPSLGLEGASLTSQRRARRLHPAAIVGLALAAVWFLAGPRALLPLYSPKSEHPEAEPDWTWESVKPQRQLTWERCYAGEFDCARLDVPMDWLDPTDEQRVVLALIRLRASSNDTNYKGPVFFNPGGPGGSGVAALKDHGRKLQTVIGANHDLVSWDPRGVGASVPRVRCWETAEQERSWALQDVGVYGAHPGVVYDAYARATAFSQACERGMNHSSGLLTHIGTASHARDLLELVEQSSGSGGGGDGLLRYWGFSYGTLLGGTFAAMWPERVARLVSDGNVDYREWYEQRYVNFIRDADKVMDAFYRFCHEAGPLRCAFHADAPAMIEERLEALLEAVRRHPVILPASPSGGEEKMPHIIGWSDLKRLVSRALYQPIHVFPRLASILAALEAGDGAPFYEFVRGESAGAPLCSAVDPVPPTVPSLEEDTDDAFPAVMCADLPGVEDSVEEFDAFARGLVAMSGAAGGVNTLFRLSCVGRRVRPKWRFGGPFEGVHTGHPLLYVANVADNVTPLVSARNNSAGFPGSRILVQNSYGHTTLSAPSKCTAEYIRAYFQDGTLPAEGTVCEPDAYPFQDVKPEEVQDELSVALRELSGVRWGFARVH